MCSTVIHTFSLQSWNSPKRQSISSSSSMSASFELFKSECVERSWLFVNKQPSVTGEGHEFIPYRDVLLLLPRPMLLPECCRALPKLGTMCKSPSEILSSEFIPNQYYNYILSMKDYLSDQTSAKMCFLCSESLNVSALLTLKWNYATILRYKSAVRFQIPALMFLKLRAACRRVAHAQAPNLASKADVPRLQAGSCHNILDNADNVEIRRWLKLSNKFASNLWVLDY